MENFHPPSVPSTTTITSTHQTNNSQSSTCEPMSCLPSTTYSPSVTQYRYYPALLYARNYYPYHQAGLPMYPFLGGAQPNMILSREQASLDRSRWILDALMSKSARNERKISRQRSLSLSRNAANTAVSSTCSPPVSRHPPFHGNHDDDTCGIISTSSSGNGADLQNPKEQLYPFCTLDNKKLRLLFNKELKNSDVGPLGRIIVPKKEAENNLPMLSEKEGIQLTVRDVHSDQHWEFKYKHWSNNRSRMYVFEYTGAFVRQKRLEAGDCIYLYEDECKNIYIYVEKVPRPARVAEPSSSQQRNTTTNHTDQTANINTSLEANNTDNRKTNTNLKADNTNDKTPNTDAKTHRSNPYVASNLFSPSPSPSPFTYVAGYEEDELSLELLMEQLKQEQEANVFADALSVISASSSAYMEHEEATTLSNNIADCHMETSTKPPSTLSAGIDPSSSSSSQSRAMVRMVNDDQPEFDDCYKGLGTLPEVDHYKYM
ncbi:B3 domain-containing transcription factor LEC2-like [Pyrus communis]|uniref:B3 domain-containing transcription factor LEC2-like n=1 Tax=Pyrus communis TaxID=23211 RepID=UPI0035C0AF68